LTGDNHDTRVWISDGSGMPFVDVAQLPVSHPGLTGRPAPYKGAVDLSVPIGTARPLASRADDTFVPEAEWCLTFPDGMQPYLAHPERVDRTTPVIFQGMIEGKWLSRILGSMAWCPVSLGNNVLAEGPGVMTTLGAVENGIENDAIGAMVVSYVDARGRTQRLESTLADLRGQSIFDLVQAVLAHCRETGTAIDWIDFSAQGPAAAIQNDPKWLLGAVRTSGVNPAALSEPAALQRVVDRVVRDILEAGLAVPVGTPVSLVVHDQRANVAGQGELTWHRASGEEPWT